MSVKYIAERTDRANELMRYGWELVDHTVVVSGTSGGGVGSFKELSERGVSRAIDNMRGEKVEARAYILELKNYKRCTCRLDSPCIHCQHTGFICEQKEN